MGSLIALEAAAAARRERVRRLALLGVAARMPVHPDLLKAAAGRSGRGGDLIVSWGHGPVGPFRRQPGAGPLAAWAAAQRLLERAGAGVLASDLAACDAYDAVAQRRRVIALPDACCCWAPTTA